MQEPLGIPVMLEVAGRRCVVVGGGPVGLRRAEALAKAGAQVVVVAPDMEPGLLRLAEENEDMVLHRRGYETGDLVGAFLVVIATNVDEVNRAVRREVYDRGSILMNGAHAALGSDFTFMGAERRGPLTIAVHTDGASANAGKQIRKTLIAGLDNDWQPLLEQAAIARDSLYAVQDPALRRQAMLELVDESAMRTLKEQGVAGLEVLHGEIVERAQRADRAR